jgi:hypothetical protein
MWLKSAIWSAKAKNFITDKLSDEQLDEIKSIRMEVDEGNGGIKEKTDSDYIWTFDRANQLLCEYTSA